MESTPDRYTTTAIVLHWVIALLVFGQIGFGWYLEEIPRGTPARSVYVNFHKSIGVTLGLLILFRVYWRLSHPAPALPAVMSTWERTAARWSHGALYACMLIMPLSGYVASNFSKWGVKFFNVVPFPPWGPDNPAIYSALNSVHVLTSYVFVALIVVHALAALRHLALRDRIFGRMWILRRAGDEGPGR